ncbi:hypothetical protein LZ012_11345 [Dechloromonas sp. XY25]|uniref:Uncharacterized protein n=1 Tax=Dechloromonas hankyongensis TaxID=2908002 RepID=A0ABS9K334_9RHOO|nr:hypothetical protein [Dechloromonas hankyongensis]MCG2577587.1 hypothetical protein [Dechloromonas hankyongensis]
MIPSFQDLNSEDQRHTLAFFFAFDSMFKAENGGDTDEAHFWCQICDTISGKYPKVLEHAQTVCSVLLSRLESKAA